MVVSALLNLLNTLKMHYWHYLGNVRLHTLVLLFTASTWGDCSFFFSLHFYFLLFVSVCLSVHLLVCVCVRVSVCLSLCLSVFMYYVYMYVVFIVINVCKLLHVRRPTSSPRDVWNPCKINKASN